MSTSQAVRNVSSLLILHASLITFFSSSFAVSIVNIGYGSLIIIKVHEVAEAVCPAIVYDHRSQIFLFHITFSVEVVIFFDQFHHTIELSLIELIISN